MSIKVIEKAETINILEKEYDTYSHIDEPHAFIIMGIIEKLEKDINSLTVHELEDGVEYLLGIDGEYTSKEPEKKEKLSGHIVKPQKDMIKQ